MRLLLTMGATGHTVLRLNKITFIFNGDGHLCRGC
jgi:hypothetical protein